MPSARPPSVQQPTALKPEAQKPVTKPKPKEPGAGPASGQAERPATQLTFGSRRRRPPRRVRSPVVWLRPLLLLLGFLAIGAVVLLLAAYRFGRTETPDETAEPPARRTAEQILSGQGFDYTQTIEGERVFRIRADESQQDRDGTSFLTTVLLDIYREDGQTYTVKSSNARINEETWEARLEGDVKLAGWDKLELETRALELRRQGQVLLSNGAVEFSFPPEFVGRASQLRVDRRTDTITLSGGVHLHTVPGAERAMRLDCQQMVYQRAAGVLRAVGKATLKSDDQLLSAHFLTLFLEEDGRTLESIRARWNVVGKGAVTDDLGQVTEIEYRGEFLDIKPDDLDPTADRIKLDGEGERVSLKISDQSGLARIFTGLYLLGTARDGQLTKVEGVGDPLVVLEALDLPDPFPLRQACAEHVLVRFLPEGGVGTVQLTDRVELNDPQLSMSGGRKATLDASDGSFRIQGPEVVVTNPRGEIVARQFTWARETGLIRAYAGVRAVLTDRSLTALRGTPLGQGEGPIQVESEEAYWTSAPPTFSFDGEVRAWRGRSLLLAQQLRGNEQDQELAASGGVHTVWTADGEEVTGADAGAAPIEVDAKRLTYLRNVHQLVYEEDVELKQGQRTIGCKELRVELDSGGRAERMTCNEDVRMLDPASGRRIEGERAVYTLAEEMVEIFGEEVELRDRDNNRMRGRYVRYDLKAGTFNIRSRPRPDVVETDSP